MPPGPRRFQSRNIRLSVDVRAGPEAAWAAVTSARRIRAWWVDKAETASCNGGRVRLVGPLREGCRGPEYRGSFVDLERGKKVAWLWDKTCLPRGAPPLATLFLEPRGRCRCRATLVHAGFPIRASMEAGFEHCLRGWEDFLAKLALYLETGCSCKGKTLTLAEAGALRRGR